MNPIADFPPDVASTQSPTPESSLALGAILDYLEHQLPGYRFDDRLDMLFVRELLEDFPDMDILEEIKNLRSLSRQPASVGRKDPEDRAAALSWPEPPAFAIADPFARCA